MNKFLESETLEQIEKARKKATEVKLERDRNANMESSKLTI